MERAVENSQLLLAPLGTLPMKLFFGLQIADILATVMFRSLGIAESNPLVEHLMEHFGTLGGLVIVKAAAIAVAIACGMALHPNFVRRMNWLYCGFVTLNVLTIVHAAS